MTSVYVYTGAALVLVTAVVVLWRVRSVRRDLRALARWPETVLDDRDAALRELLEHARSVLRVKRVEAVWRAHDGGAYAASLDGNTFKVREVPEPIEPAKMTTPVAFASRTASGMLCIRERCDDALAAIVAKLVATGLDQINLVAMMSDRSVAERFRLAYARPELFTRRNRLSGQLARMTYDIASQWDLQIDLDADRNIDILDVSLARQLMMVVAEGLTNAAKHAGAKRIGCSVRIDEQSVRVDISDDGHGFPFRGRYELRQLMAEQRGPWSLKERIVALGGDLSIDSSTRGSRLEVRLPRAS